MEVMSQFDLFFWDNLLHLHAISVTEHEDQTCQEEEREKHKLPLEQNLFSKSKYSKKLKAENKNKSGPIL